MRNFIIASLIVGIIYLLSLILLIIRRKSPYILRRSPLMLSLSLIGGFFLSLISLSQVKQLVTLFPSFTGQKCFIFYRIRQACTLFFHSMTFIPYILRAYRLYLIFKLDKHWENQESSFTQYFHRTKQSWMLLAFIILMIPASVSSIIILASCEYSSYFPAPESKEHMETSDLIYVAVCFIEQLMFIFSVYILRDVTDDYNMTKEIFVAMLFWFLTPLFSVFPPAELGDYQLLPGIIRNIVLLYFSVVYPIICSFIHKPVEEIITLEMLGSLESILQAKTPLEYFEAFLRDHEGRTNESNFEYSGNDVLQLFMKCENILTVPEDYDKEELIDELLKSEVVSVNYSCEEKDTFEEVLIKAKTDLLEYLSEKYFARFKGSLQYEILRRIVHRQEIYTGRLMKIGLFSGAGYSVRDSFGVNNTQ